MATPAYRVLDKRGTSAGSMYFNEATVYRTNRRWFVHTFNRDVQQNLGNYARAQLASLARWTYENFAALRAAIDQIATLATQHLLSQSYAEDRIWADEAERVLLEHDKIIDLAGWPYDYAHYRRLLVASVLMDGDCGTLLTETTNGWPAIQIIPSHRISSNGDDEVKDGPFKGARLMDGVIVNDYGAALGYRVIGETTESVRDISAADMFLSYVPRYVGQVRGYSALGASILDFQDIAETRSFEKLAQKKGAGLDFAVENESGEPELPSSLFRTEAGTEAGTTIYREKLDGGLTTYFRAGTGGKITPIQTDRPSTNQAAFEERLLRAAMASLGWSYDLALDATKIGGASLRVVVDQCNRTLEDIRLNIAERACRRVDGWRVAKLIKLGVIPQSADWWKWEFQPPAKLTSDRGYESDISIQEVQNCMSSEYREAARRGGYPEDFVEDRIRFLKYVDKRAKEEGLDPARVYPGGPTAQKVTLPAAQRVQGEDMPQPKKP